MAVEVEGHGKTVGGGEGLGGELVSERYGLRATLRQGKIHVGKTHRGQVLSVDAPATCSKVPQLGPCTSSGRAWWLRAARHSSQGGQRPRPPAAKSLARGLERAASKVADFAAFDHQAPGFRFSIESMPARKFADPADQIKYAHLNLKFDEGDFPTFSDGFLAQLAGVPPWAK